MSEICGRDQHQTYNFKNYESIVGSFDPKEWVVGEI